MRLIKVAFLLIVPAVLHAGETANFTSPQPGLAEFAEVMFGKHSEFWIGKKLPPLIGKCRIDWVKPTGGSGGWTKMNFESGIVNNWRMQVQGRQEMIDSRFRTRLITSCSTRSRGHRSHDGSTKDARD